MKLYASFVLCFFLSIVATPSLASLSSVTLEDLLLKEPSFPLEEWLFFVLFLGVLPGVLLGWLISWKSWCSFIYAALLPLIFGYSFASFFGNIRMVDNEEIHWGIVYGGLFLAFLCLCVGVVRKVSTMMAPHPSWAGLNSSLSAGWFWLRFLMTVVGLSFVSWYGIFQVTGYDWTDTFIISLVSSYAFVGFLVTTGSSLSFLRKKSSLFFEEPRCELDRSQFLVIGRLTSVSFLLSVVVCVVLLAVYGDYWE